METAFHPDSDVPVTYLPGYLYTCEACGEEDALSVWKDDEGIVSAKCYGGCY